MMGVGRFENGQRGVYSVMRIVDRGNVIKMPVI